MKHALNKHRMNQLQGNLALYEKFLPALDLKRQQLMALQKTLQSQLLEIESQHDALMNSISQAFPFAHRTLTDLTNLIAIESIKLSEQHHVGVCLRQLNQDTDVRFTAFALHDQGLAPSPHWLGSLYRALKPLLICQIRLDLIKQNILDVNQAAKKATQKVNLFSEVMIPQAQQEMRKIRLFLADQEKSAVIRSKLAKAKTNLNRQANTSLNTLNEVPS